MVVLSMLGLFRLSSVIPCPAACLFNLAALLELRMGLATSAAAATELFLLAFKRPTDFSALGAATFFESSWMRPALPLETDDGGGRPTAF